MDPAGAAILTGVPTCCPSQPGVPKTTYIMPPVMAMQIVS